MRRYAADDQWDRIKEYSAGARGPCCASEAVLFRFRAGVPGAICPSALAMEDRQSASTDGKSGVFERVFRLFQDDDDVTKRRDGAMGDA